MATRITVRRDTLANWQSSNPILADGEPAWVSDTKDLLNGNGSDNFNTLWIAAQSIPNRAAASANAAASSASSAAAAVAPLALPKFRAALARVRGGIGDAKVLCVGDSTTAGVGSDSATPAAQGGINAYPHQLARLLNVYVPSARGLGVPASKLTNSNPDPRWTPGATWALANFGWGNGSDWTTAGDGSTNSLTYSDGVLADTYDVYYIQANGLGGMTITATGGSAVTVATSGTSSIRKVTVTAGAAATTNTVTVTPSGATTPIHILGIEPYQSTVRKVRVGNAGVGGSTTANWVQQSGDFGGMPAIKAYAPDLTIISLGINDSNAALTAATFSSNLQQIVTAAASSGDVLLLSPFPSTSSASTNNIALEQQYAQAAAALGNTYLGLFARFGTPGTDTTKNLGMMSDALHPNALGYADLAQLLTVALARV